MPLRNWLANVGKIVRGRQVWSAESEFAYYAVSRRVVEEHRQRQDEYAAECWLSGMRIMKQLGILDARLPGSSVLDIGAGECVLAGAIAHCGASEVWAVDAIPKQIWAAADKLAERDNIKFVIAGADDLPFADACFEIVTANLVLHHIEPVAPVAREVLRCLKPGGRFAALEPAPLVGTLVHEASSDNEAPVAPSVFVRELEKAGFVDVGFQYAWGRLGTSALGPLSPAYVLSATKPARGFGAAPGPTRVSLRRALRPMNLVGLQLDESCAFREQALRQAEEILAVRG